MPEDRMIVLARLLRKRGYAPDSRTAVAEASAIMDAAERFAEIQHRALQTKAA